MRYLQNLGCEEPVTFGSNSICSRLPVSYTRLENDSLLLPQEHFASQIHCDLWIIAIGFSAV